MTTYGSDGRWYARADVLVALLRITLGVIFVVGGIKLAFLGETTALVAGYTDPATGWISPVFQAQITQRLGLSVGVFLRSQGLLEMLLGLLMILGLGTRMVALLIGLMFWSFTVANPVAGEIRLSRDLALMGDCLAVVLSGAGAWSLDGRLWQRTGTFLQCRDGVLLLLRLSLAYPLLASAVFTDGPFANPLNTTMPVVVVLFIGVLLAAGVYPRWITGLLGVWMCYVVATSMLDQGVYFGLDAAKRELGMLAAGMVYALLGPDRWAWPKTSPTSPAAPPQAYGSVDGDRTQDHGQQVDASVTTGNVHRSSH